MLRQAKGCVALATLLIILLVWYTMAFSGNTPSTAFFKTLVTSRDNVRELWNDGPFQPLFKVASVSPVGSVAITDASEDASILQGHVSSDAGVLQRPPDSSKMTKEWLQRKVGYLYAIQGAQMQLDFTRRPRVHKIVEGVIDPISYTDSERQKKAYAKMVAEEKKNREKEKEKQAKLEIETKTKEEEEKRKKEEELRKSEEEKKQLREKKEKEEASEKAKAEANKLQAEADEEGKANDDAFLVKDMEAHLNISSDLPKYSGSGSIFVVTPLSETTSDKQTAIVKNREAYCARHGYTCLFPKLSSVPNIYIRWSSVQILRNYFSKSVEIKENDWVWFLKTDVVITNLEEPIADVLLEPESLKTHLSYGSRFLSRKDHYHTSVRFPSVVEDTSKLDIVLSRGPKSFNLDSFLIRNTETIRFWLDMWDDHVVAHITDSESTVQGDVLQYLFLNHATLRNVVGVVTPRLLMSQPSSDKSYLKWQTGDLTGQFDCNGPDAELCSVQWEKLTTAAAASIPADVQAKTNNTETDTKASSDEKAEKKPEKDVDSSKVPTKEGETSSSEKVEKKPEEAGDSSKAPTSEAELPKSVAAAAAPASSSAAVDAAPDSESESSKTPDSVTKDTTADDSKSSETHTDGQVAAAEAVPSSSSDSEKKDTPESESPAVNEEAEGLKAASKKADVEQTQENTIDKVKEAAKDAGSDKTA